MDKKFNISIPKNETSKEDRQNIIRGLLNHDLKNDGILAKILIFLYNNQPLTTTGLTDILNSHYDRDISRTNVFRALAKLVQKNLVDSISTGVLYQKANSEELKEIEVEILRKHANFIRKFPENFRGKLSDINYFWVANGEGEKYLEWCAKLLDCGFEKKNIGEEQENAVS